MMRTSSWRSGARLIFDGIVILVPMFARVEFACDDFACVEFARVGLAWVGFARVDFGARRVCFFAEGVSRSCISTLPSKTNRNELAISKSSNLLKEVCTSFSECSCGHTILNAVEFNSRAIKLCR